MDISDEKEKAKFVYKLELRKLIIDKMFLGLVVVLIGLSANFVLEKYRSGLTQERFIIEKRFEAINNIKDSHDELFDLFDNYTVDMAKNNLPSDYENRFRQKYNDFTLKAIKYDLLLPKKLNLHMSFFIWIYGGVEYKGFETFRSMDWKTRLAHRAFMNEVRKCFYALCREALGIKNDLNEPVFFLEEMTFAEASEVGSEAYYDKNFDNWTKLNSNKGTN